MKPMNLAIGDKLLFIRKKMGLTQAKFSEKLGLSARFYQDIEQGKSEPSLSSLRKILDTLEMTDTEFFGVTQPRMTPEDAVTLIKPILECIGATDFQSAIVCWVLTYDESYVAELPDKTVRSLTLASKIV